MSFHMTMGSMKTAEMGVRRCKSDGEWMCTALLHCDQARIAHWSGSWGINIGFNVGSTSVKSLCVFPQRRIDLNANL